ncbi:class I SAM-dependent methyltransferase [Streptomyces sp. HMX112]|uniref:class I SAM-dependent methyltransferase n=1 Tax=Streptomyces sp. HMX112 TaxID=3390850 RepID=UPI003A8039A8
MEALVHDVVQTVQSCLIAAGVRIREGSSSPAQLADLMKAASASDVRRIVEVGFHTGLSSYAFLEANPKALVTSFDLGFHACVGPAKELIDKTFPGRHQLVIGDSKTTLPEYRGNAPDVEFDLAFIDGGHRLEDARSDIECLARMCRPGATVIVDDILPDQFWGKGPSQAWDEKVREGVVVERARRSSEPSGDVFSAMWPRLGSYPLPRCWVIGTFV